MLGEGGLRERVMQGVAVVQTRLAERTASQDEEQALSSTEDNNSAKEDEKEGDETAGHGNCENDNKTKGVEHHNDSSDDYSSVDLRERVKQNNSKEEENKEEEQKEESVGKEEAKEGYSTQEEDRKNEEGTGLLVDLKAFSGSAIWSEEKMEEPNVTAL